MKTPALEALEACARLGCIRVFWGARQSCLDATDGRDLCATCMARDVLTPDRADPLRWSQSHTDMEEDPEGEWVRWDDYRAGATRYRLATPDRADPECPDCIANGVLCHKHRGTPDRADPERRAEGLDWGLAGVLRQYLRLADALPDEKPYTMPTEVWDARVRELDNARTGVESFLSRYAALTPPPAGNET